MGSRLYVGNLSFESTEAGLQAHFEQTGCKVASVAVVQDRATGRSRGFAFVDMTSDADAQTAIKAFDGSQFDGRSLKVSEAAERKPRQGYSER
ncbi:MAG: RNA recognition motif domain-containing protein [Planctomycetota bacterium]